jgi:hypothetical protein
MTLDARTQDLAATDSFNGAAYTIERSSPKRRAQHRTLAAVRLLSCSIGFNVSHYLASLATVHACAHAIHTFHFPRRPETASAPWPVLTQSRPLQVHHIIDEDRVLTLQQELMTVKKDSVDKDKKLRM